MCPMNCSRGCVENRWCSTSTPLYMSTEHIAWLGENGCSPTFAPLHVSTELFMSCLSWENVQIYIQYPTCFHCTYHLAVLIIGGALPPLPYLFPLNFLSRSLFQIMWSSTSTPLHVSSELFITWLAWECVELYLHSPSCVHSTFYHVAVFRLSGALPPLRYICPLNLHVAGLRMGGALPSLPYTCPQNIFSRGWVEKLWSSTTTPLRVFTELYIMLLCWEMVELYLHSPTYFLWTYHVVGLRMGWALPPLPYMCPMTFLSLGCVEKLCSSSSKPRHESTEILISWLVWECVVLYLHSPTCIHSTFYHVTVLNFVRTLPSLRYICPLNLHVTWLRMGWALSTLPYTCPQNILSRGCVEKVWSSTSTPLHESTELLITLQCWECVELYLHSPTFVHWTFYHVAGLRNCGALPPLPYMNPLNLSRG